jgi:hypothetical protein
MPIPKWFPVKPSIGKAIAVNAYRWIHRQPIWVEYIIFHEKNPPKSRHQAFSRILDAENAKQACERMWLFAASCRCETRF